MVLPSEWNLMRSLTCDEPLARRGGVFGARVTRQWRATFAWVLRETRKRLFAGLNENNPSFINNNFQLPFSAPGNQPLNLTSPRRYSIWPAWRVLQLITLARRMLSVGSGEYCGSLRTRFKSPLLTVKR